jgi:HAD superfamily hydrolase (TIGR01490 family)
MPSPSDGPLRGAYCDVDGTVCGTDIVGPLVFFRRRLTGPAPHALWLAALPPRGLWWLALDKFSRDASNRAIYACYAGLEADQVKAAARGCFESYFRPRLHPAGLARLARLKAEGVRLVLVTGSLDFLAEILARETEADLIAPRLEERDGRFTGRLVGPPLTGARKAQEVRRHAAEHGVDLARSLSFGDAWGDVPMLECVGQPVVVNPGRRLRLLAARRGWPVEWWDRGG